MVITYNGENYFKFQSGDLSILLDPTNQRSFKGANLIINTIKPSETEPPEDEEAFWIDHAGEYEIKGIKVLGLNGETERETKKTIYRIEFDEISIVILGYLTKELEIKTQEHLKNCDVLIAPAGGKPWISQTVISKIIRQLEPGIIIPSLFKNLDPFLKEFAKEKCVPEEKLVIKKKDVETNAMKIVCLKL